MHGPSKYHMQGYGEMMFFRSSLFSVEFFKELLDHGRWR